MRILKKTAGKASCIVSFLLISCLLFSFGVTAQELKVERFELAPSDISGARYSVKDANGIDCALIKVQIPRSGVVFEGNIVKQDFRVNEYWVYVTQGTKMLNIKHPDALPLMVYFSDHKLNPATSSATYVMTLQAPTAASRSVMQKIYFDVQPANAMVICNRKVIKLVNGKGELEAPAEEDYEYTIGAEGYYPSEGSIHLYATAPGQVIARLIKETTAAPSTLPAASQSSQPVPIPVLTASNDHQQETPSPTRLNFFKPTEDPLYAYRRHLHPNLVTGDSLAYIRRYDEAQRYYATLGDDPHGILMTGLCFDQGWGVNRNISEAGKYYSRISRLDSPAGAIAKGRLDFLAQGKTARKASFNKYMTAAQVGVPAAQLLVGLCYGDGEGTKRDEKEAERWINLAYLNGCVEAAFVMGSCYENSDNFRKYKIPKKDVAFQWYLTAAEKGHPNAQMKVGEAYYEGRGVKKNQQEAKKWFRKAYESGYLPALEWINKIK